MKQRDKKTIRSKSLTTCDARKQVKAATILLAVIPALSLFYIGMSTFADTEYLPFSSKIVIFGLTLILATSGFLILRKYPENILKLRQYITEIARNTLPEKIVLVNTESCDDLQYIENHFNLVLTEMRHRVEDAEEQVRIEQSLRETIEQQHQTLMEAERHRVLIQTLGAACHHIGQPAAILQMRMDLLQKLVTNENELEEIKGCIVAVERISDILQQLQRVSEFTSVPYVQIKRAIDDKILAVSLTD